MDVAPIILAVLNRGVTVGWTFDLTGTGYRNPKYYDADGNEVKEAKGGQSNRRG